MIKTRQFIDELIANEGTSLNIETSEAPKGGYMVSLKDTEIKLPKGVKSTVNEIATAVSKLESLAYGKFGRLVNTNTYGSINLNKESVFIGGWLHKGVYYLDISVNIHDRVKSILFATNEEQIAIFNVTEGKEEFLEDIISNKALKGVKRYHIQYNVGKVKYAVSFHNGIKTHADGSDFFDIEPYNSAVKADLFIMELQKKGYIHV